MLQNFNKMLQDAYENHYAVGSFNCYNYETMKGAILAAKALNQPVIIAFGAKYLANMSLKDAYATAKQLSDEHGVTACLHLDHCPNIDTVYQAIQAGFTSVMYDGSKLPFEENAKNTAKVCQVAHACGVSVEAELGNMAATETSHEGDHKTDKEIYTDAQDAKRFVDISGCDALAVSVGTVHGLYKGEPNIRIDILQEINKALGIPLVLHGGSGIPEETILECIQNGISKINVNTEISIHTVKKIQDMVQGDKLPHLAVIAEKQVEAVEEIVTKYMNFFKGKTL